MGEATRQIEAHIEDTRADLGSNLQELEQKVKSVTDWRQYFERSPLQLLGVAFFGGILLSKVMGGHKNGGPPYPYRAAYRPDDFDNG